MSEDSGHHHDSLCLDDDAVTLQDTISTIMVQAHIHDMAHLMVLSTPAADDGEEDTTNQALFGLENQPLTPTLARPAGNASAEARKQFARQEHLKRSMLAAILKHLKLHLRYLYEDILAECGGARKAFMLTLPQIMCLLFAEQEQSAETREQDLVEKIRDATLKLDEPYPLRHYSTQMKRWITELADLGYTHPPSELLRIVQACMKPYAATSQALTAQLDAFAAHPRADRTGVKLLAHLVKYERERATQGLSVMEATTSGEHFAGQVTANGNGDALAQLNALAKSALSSEQRTVMEKYLAGAVESIKFAATHPGQIRMISQKHCPIHAFQPSHDEPDCVALHDPAAAKRMADERKAKKEKKAADKKGAENKA